MPRVLGRGWGAKINPPGAPRQSSGLCVGAVIAPHPVGTSVGTLSAARRASCTVQGALHGQGALQGQRPAAPSMGTEGPGRATRAAAQTNPFRQGPRLASSAGRRLAHMGAL